MKKETNDATNVNRMKYCSLIVHPAPINTHAKTIVLQMIATNLKLIANGTVCTNASVKPMTYIDTEIA